MLDPYLCMYCLEARFPTEEAREEHFKTCPTKMHKDRAEREQSKRIEDWYEKHPDKRRKKPREHPCDAYQRWWHGKLCRTQSDRKFKRVVEVQCLGPPSMVYGGVTLHFEDGTYDNVYYGQKHRPRKIDVEVKEE